MTSCMNPVAALGELLTVTGTPLQCDLLELCCPPDSRLVSTMLDHGQRALRIGLPAIDLSTKVGLQEVKGMIKKHRPKVLWISLPCGPYSPIQKLFNEDTPEKKEKSLLRKRHARKWIRNGIEAARTQLHLGGDLGWEWPKKCGSFFKRSSTLEYIMKPTSMVVPMVWIPRRPTTSRNLGKLC